MSQNQSRAEGNQSAQNRKFSRSGSSNQQRHFSGNSSNKGGGATALSSSGSFKKYNNNAKGGQSRAGTVSSDSNSSSEARATQNGGNQRQQNSGIYNAPVSSTSENFKPAIAPPQKVTQAVPRGPSSNVSTVQSHVSTASSDFNAPTTPAKRDTSESFPLQFGSISPGFMNGIQIPARTSSAPPNLDEQKRYQARHDSLRATPAMSTPSIPEQQLPKKDAWVSDQPKAGEAQSVSKLRRDAQVSSAPPLNQVQRPSAHPMPGMSMQIPFHQPHVPVQFGGPNPQIQSQAMISTSLPMSIPMALPLGNSPVQQPMFVSGLPPHPMQSQGMIYRGQSLNFSSAMGPQLPHLGNMGINVAQQFPHQQAGQYASPCRTVKITHPKTHEELRLGGSPVPRSNPNVPPQAQPIPSFSPHNPMNYYPNSYNSSSVFYLAPNSVPMNSTQAPQPPRFYNQVKVIVKPPGMSHGEKDPSPSASLLSVGKGEYLKPSRPHGEHSVGPQNGVESSSSISLQQSKPGLGTSSTAVPIDSEERAAVSGSVTVESALLSTSVTGTIDVSASLSANSAEEAEKEAVVRPVSIKDKQKKTGDRDQLDQVGKQSSSVSSLPSQLRKPEPGEAKVISFGAIPVLEAAKESFSVTTMAASEPVEGNTNESSEVLGVESTMSRQSRPEKVGINEQVVVKSSESSKPDKCSLETSLKSPSLKPSETFGYNKESSSQDLTSTSCGNCLVETVEGKLEESSHCHFDDASVSDDLVTPTWVLDGANAKSSVSVIGASAAHYDSKCTLDASFSGLDSIDPKETTVTNSAASNQEFAPISIPSPPEGVLKLENEDTENISSGLLPSSPGFQVKVFSESVARSTVTGAKKKKDLYRKAEAAGTSSDLYTAYKSPEEKKEYVTSAESAENTTREGTKQTLNNVTQNKVTPNVKPSLSKAEPDDWEDAVDISTPKLETIKNESEINGADDNGLTTKKYSRDFLLKFAAQCTNLPEGFEVTTKIDNALLVSGDGVLRESHPSPGRNTDRPIGGSRSDRRGNAMGGDDKRNKLPGPLMSVRGDMQMDIGYLGNVGFRPGQSGINGVPRNPRLQTPGQYTGGIFPGPMHSPGMQGDVQRNNSDSDRWQRGTAFQKGLMHFPQTPLQVMHKAEKKYEVGKVTDEEQAKQRQLKAILNKLTPQNFEKLFEQVKQVNIDNVITLSGVISQIFDKALTEPTFCEMYANFCFHLSAELPDLSIENERITFKRLLLNKCQIEFERGEREEEEANKAGEEGEDKQSEGEREEKRLRARRRMLGNIRLIGELYKKRMLTERIMHECIKKLLGQYQNPDEEDVEALCKLMSTIGEIIDHPKAKEHMDAYFDIMAQMSSNMKLSSRVRFMLKDVIDLRKNKWQQRRKVEGPKKIEEVHRDAAQERQTQAGRLARVPSIGTSVRRGPSMDFAPRGSNMFSPNSQTGGFRAVPSQIRGYVLQDARLEERHSFENRTMSVPLPQRPVGDESITLGPQGGLARGMAFRGQPTAPSIQMAEMPSSGDAPRMESGLNGFSSMPERTTYGNREDLMSKHMPVRFASPTIYGQSHQHEWNMTNENRDIRNIDRNFDRSLESIPTQGGPINSMQALPEKHLHDMSVAAIKEFYSANDVNEVALCIKELRAPNFYPSMISIWISDSFERKDMERDLLTELLINLAKPRDGMLSRDQLIKGFESVLAGLEDAVNDAPRAAEFLGRIFAKVILDDIVPFSEIGRLIYEGGEEQGRLIEIGLAAEVLGTILEMIKSEKGDSALSEICSSSDLQLENFRPPGSNKSWRIDKFL
ncbi:eukaryotic translation initiation factor 4G isoform X1 [Olea europaea subsp. europaea]|uniref:Eukaryotic translation initiation factor 4G n=2 Tax=Olea europaea subsp. europaea TaxID=158383 RepID=A0A8S0VNP7_OLEEU|nr:eukaryotic translation initiation factor 4G isoform X1 [Olea europaea subsp. europaea]